jgi:hypothetical protein
MQTIQSTEDDFNGMLEQLGGHIPVLIGKPCAASDPHYPCSGKFFGNMRRLAHTPFPGTPKAVAKFSASIFSRR